MTSSSMRCCSWPAEALRMPCMLSFSTHSCCRSHLRSSQQGPQHQGPPATGCGAPLHSWRGSLTQGNLLPASPRPGKAPSLQVHPNPTLSPRPVLCGAAAPPVGVSIPLLSCLPPATVTMRHPKAGGPPLHHSRPQIYNSSSAPRTLFSLPVLPERPQNWGLSSPPIPP